MRVGIYVDGFNLYYGARRICGQGTAGWRWLDLRKLGADLVARHSGWPTVTASRVIFCTARIRGDGSAPGPREQDVYLRALRHSGSVDEIAMGNYVSRVATAPLATPSKRGKPVLTKPGWPVMVKDGAGTDDPHATFMASVAGERRAQTSTSPPTFFWMSSKVTSMRPWSSATTATWHFPSRRRGCGFRSGWSIRRRATRPEISTGHRTTVSEVTGGISSPPLTSLTRNCPILSESFANRRRGEPIARRAASLTSRGPPVRLDYIPPAPFEGVYFSLTGLAPSLPGGWCSPRLSALIVVARRRVDANGEPSPCADAWHC